MSEKHHRTSYAVWEITLKCNLACSHCGSRAGQARHQELSTAEALNLVQQLAEVGIKEVTLIGGEAFLRPDWLVIAKAITDAGMLCGMTTGGYGISLEMAQRMKEAGIAKVSVSTDGMEATHDHLRGRKGSWKSGLRTMSYLKEVGILFGCNTQINRLSAPEFPSIYEHIRDAGARAWQIQLTVPMGNAADNADILLQPSELLDLYPMLARVAQRANTEGVRVAAGNNIGYYGPYERLLRGQGKEWGFWRGCGAGLSTLGLEADGTIKGCPSLPTTAYAGGNIRERPLREIVEQSEELQFNLYAGTPEGTAYLWGFCKTCKFAELCRGGCTWTAHVFFNRRGNNPYCHHRALELAKRGLRERVYPKVSAPGVPFDNGEFTIIEEPLDAPWIENDPLHFTADSIQWPDSWQSKSELFYSVAR
ncbi:nif11-class peptide radical SAM maturase 3 [Anabaena sp. FACHB-709]|uniref:Heme biosynthesis protein n=2 Tax=Nostocaceae TaxID=1162 RepID=A0A1Z4KFC2_ANAVA|nr:MULTISPECIES: nif11-class peptide radical SAM maturase 3 [Nostocaceae]BAY67649.1 heme biosynthesis protein [Trichormus variabilis NIES-23]HBW33033.1 nif11-class peptide radical SAM maturase 3 [Nostoc sp. UBA8866]MBD2173922.1 nif11-class peptide radical SAM maturase 3 [Anabaena cylindrica FACHB-318]MBD2265671.1 nif11-class peptide radical SAM maturase 3 [Anabaena sp. FACHB-709]MBD2275028.1 nif11-class peptide radical SAM maturase 3 [Nostoc sp. PCC 7120 = FACHB-418]